MQLPVEDWKLLSQVVIDITDVRPPRDQQAQQVDLHPRFESTTSPEKLRHWMLSRPAANEKEMPASVAGMSTSTPAKADQT